MDRIHQPQAQPSPGTRAPLPATPAMSEADTIAHQLASYVRPHTQDDDPQPPKIPHPRKPRTAGRLDLIEVGA